MRNYKESDYALNKFSEGALLFENLKQDKNCREVIFSFESRVLLKTLFTALKNFYCFFIQIVRKNRDSM